MLNAWNYDNVIGQLNLNFFKKDQASLKWQENICYKAYS